MEKNVINIEGAPREEHAESSKPSEVMDGSKQKATDASLEATGDDDTQTDYSSKAKNHTTFSHYWVVQPGRMD